jgi:hypothetical protein
MKQVFQTLQSRDAGAIRDTVMKGWLRSVDDERILELFALSQAIRVLHSSRQWDQFDLDFGKGGSLGSLIVSARNSTIASTIRFDVSPDEPGNYKWVINRYSGIDGRGRRPDLIISTTVGNARRTTFIEVKATKPNSQYGRDSIVKVLGYLKDYETVWKLESEIAYPRCLLLYADNVYPNTSREFRFQEDELVLSDANSFQADLSELFGRHMAADSS